MILQIDGNLLKNMIVSGANYIENHKKAVNDLNVFPVPDGDTGTNMSLTMSAAVRELKTISSDCTEEVAKKIAGALLRGARGNSGVILSLLFRGFAKAMEGIQEATAKDFARGLALGVEMAYKAVMKPTEGTILTVARLAADYAMECSCTKEDILEVFEGTIARGKEALEDTPNLLPVLKQANVVDAGGMGLLLIYEGALKYLKTGTMIECSPQEMESEKFSATADFAALNTEDIQFQYCTEFIVLHGKNDKAPQKLRTYLEEIGDSVVVVDDDEIIKVHIHTDHPGEAIEKAIAFGSLTNVKIENMKEQHSELVLSPEEREQEQEQGNYVAEAEKEYGFVVVCSGEGIANVFCDLGVDTIVQGGQTMNPSTEDILKAINQTPASTVFVFPNNKNIIMAAEQTVPIVKEKKVVVIPSKTIPQGVTALLNFDEGATPADNQAAMAQAMNLVKTGQITFAARDSQFDGQDIKEGQLLGMADGQIQVVGENLTYVVLELIELMKDDQSEILTLYYGADVTKEQVQEILDRVQEAYNRQFEIVLIDGEQPVYQMIIAVE